MPLDVRSELVRGVVSFAGSALDGSPVKTIAPVPFLLNTGTGTQTGASPAQSGVGVSAPAMLWSEFIRRQITSIDSPSATLDLGASGFQVAVNTPTSGIFGKIQGHPFRLSGGASAFNVALLSTVSTTSAQIRKVLVTLGMPAQPYQSAIGLASAVLQLVVGSAMTTSSTTVISGGDIAFDRVPLPLPSAGEVPVGWLNVPNNFPISAAVSATMVWSDFRALQGMNMSALLIGVPQP